MDGFGNPCGLLPFPQTGERVIGYNRALYTLYEVWDISGQLLYRSPTAETDKLPEDTCRSPRQIYDLFGRAVGNPLPGSIYIVDGRKVLWK